MSTFRTPVGPQPSNVYWRRRLVVGLALLAVIVIILMIIFAPKGDAPKPSQVNPTTSATQPATDPSALCAPAVIDVKAATDKSSYAAGENPQLTLEVTNMGSVACTIDVSASQQEFLITSGSELYWNSRDCQAATPETPALLIVLQPNESKKTTPPYVWERVRSSPTNCSGAPTAVPGGGASYHLNINLGTIASNDVQFSLN
ncbi:MAG: hypothetical protein ABIW32_08490 [Terrimesophilobacter sp.]